MTAKNRILKFLEHLEIGQSTFEKKVGISNGYINNLKDSIGSKIISKISTAYPELDTLWLLTGEGNMLKSDDNATEVGTINYEGKGVPCYDVDFIGGFDIVFNDQTIQADYYVNFKQYNAADCWVNVTGKSMEPEISSGDMIAIKELNDWRTHILYGEMYALVTEENRTIKYVRRSERGDDWLRLIPANTQSYDEQDIPKNVVRKVFKVLGAAKRFQ